MSFKHQALRDLVVERLAVAADEIFALFERTFAEFEAEVCLRSEHGAIITSESVLEQREEQRKENSPDHEVQSLVSQTRISSPYYIKHEEKTVPLEVPFPCVAVKSEEQTSKTTFLHQDPAEERQNYIQQQSGGEEPGCSLDLNIQEPEPDTDDSDDWRPPTQTATRSQGQTSNFYQIHFDYQRQQGFTEESVSFPPPTHFPNEAPNDAKDKPFTCSVCAKSFPQKRILTAHLRIHTGERPYHCKPCGLSFRFQQNYFQHDLAVHRREKPFRCRVCKKDFVHKLEMVAHRKTHDVKSLGCSKCGKVFNCVRYLRRHMERCPRKKRRPSSARATEDGGLPMSFSPQNEAWQEGQRLDSRMFNTSVNEWL